MRKIIYAENESLNIRGNSYTRCAEVQINEDQGGIYSRNLVPTEMVPMLADVRNARLCWLKPGAYERLTKWGFKKSFLKYVKEDE